MWDVRQAYAILARGRLPGCPTITDEWNAETQKDFVNAFGATLPANLVQAMMEPDYQAHRRVWIDYWLMHNNRLPEPVERCLALDLENSGSAELSEYMRLKHMQAERHLEKVREGIKRAKASGIHCGRPRVQIPMEIAHALQHQGYSEVEIARVMGVSRSTLRRRLQAETS